MPRIFRISNYIVHFWSNEGVPLEPVHIHISKGKPNAYSTKIWITKDGKCKLANNNSKIPDFQLNTIMKLIEVQYIDEIKEKWIERFDEITFI